jgi:hypothetical protein
MLAVSTRALIIFAAPDELNRRCRPSLPQNHPTFDLTEDSCTRAKAGVPGTVVLLYGQGL